jgi:cephalosporin hydroxylase
MFLSDIVDNNLTDKNTTHSYIDLYDKLLWCRKNTAKNVLEVGIGDFNDKNGGSILMWRKYFTNATIYGLDILSLSHVIDELLNDDRVILYTETNAYDENFVSDKLSDLRFDVLLDDGPHSMASMINFIKLYSPLLSDDGILIIEDVQDMSWLDVLKRETPDELKNCICTFDLRKNKGRYDDIVFVIDKKLKS